MTFKNTWTCNGNRKGRVASGHPRNNAFKLPSFWMKVINFFGILHFPVSGVCLRKDRIRLTKTLRDISKRRAAARPRFGGRINWGVRWSRRCDKNDAVGRRHRKWTTYGRPIRTRRDRVRGLWRTLITRNKDVLRRA